MSSSIISISAYAAAVLFGLSIILQLLLAAGILPVTMAWGGRQSVLTTSLKLASLAAAVVLGFFAYVIFRRAGIVGSDTPPTIIKALSWVITAFLALNTVGNFASKSRGEKLLFAPITLLLTVACFVISIS
ncbi:MAG: hypothetical protein GY805_08960 [Chloroflexi bacterium]|nr:hypothetical protein [Chloroflexota bacterium]